MNNKIELFAATLEANKEQNILTGYAVLFNEKSKLMERYGNEFYTMVSPSAFDPTEQTDIKLLLEHDPSQILAREQNGSLKFSKDDKGLKFEAFLGNSMLQRDVVELVSQGLYSAMSFGVSVLDEDWEEFSDSPPVRTITKGDIFEFSVTASPMFEATNCMVASDTDTSADAYFRNKENAENAKKLLEQQTKFFEMLSKI